MPSCEGWRRGGAHGPWHLSVSKSSRELGCPIWTFRSVSWLWWWAVSALEMLWPCCGAHSGPRCTPLGWRWSWNQGEGEAASVLITGETVISWDPQPECGGNPLSCPE